MRDTKRSKVWLPGGEMSGGQQIALSIACQVKPSERTYRDMLQWKIQALIEANPNEAKWALEMFGLNQIVFESEVSGWAANLMFRDVMMVFQKLIDWNQPGEFVELAEPETIGSFMEALP